MATMVIAHMGTMAIAIAPTVIMAIGDTDTMALDPIADTGPAVHIVDGAKGEYTSSRITAPFLSISAAKSKYRARLFLGPVLAWVRTSSSTPNIGWSKCFSRPERALLAAGLRFWSEADIPNPRFVR